MVSGMEMHFVEGNETGFLHERKLIISERENKGQTKMDTGSCRLVGN